MANLYSGKIQSNGEYINLAEATGLTFEEGVSYQIQFLNQGYIREGEEGTGFLVTSIDPFSFSVKNSNVYVRSIEDLGINIAE